MRSSESIASLCTGFNEHDGKKARGTRPERQPNRDLKDLAILSWVICLFTICLLLVSETQKDAERDFVYFYSVGRIANEHSPEQIYNFDLQRQTFEAVYRLKGDRVYGPSPYPPFIPLLFRPFSHLPFETAFHLWQLCTLALFWGGVGLLAGMLWPKQRLVQSLVFAAGFSFCPFIADTLAAGQLAAIGCFAFSLALFEQGRGRFFRSGLALSLALYKPTLLLLVLPMLLVRRQWRTLAGVMAGGASLFALVTAFLGVRVWTAYLEMLLSLGRLQGLLDFSRYVDVFAFSTLLARNHVVVKDLILVSIFAVAGSFVVRAWMRSNDARMVWAATLTWTLFLNIYVPIYDSALVIPGIVVSAPALIGQYRRSFTAAALLLFGCSWISELAARMTGIQILSIALAILGALQLRAAFVDRKRGLGLPNRAVCDFDLSPAEAPSVDSSPCLPAQSRPDR